MSIEHKIRVGIRGIAGLLGSRLALALQKQQDMEVTVGIAKYDATLKDRILKGNWPAGMPAHFYLDDKHEVVRQANKENPSFHFEPADQLNLRELCDIVIDAAAPRTREKWDEKYAHFRKPVVIQSGEYPHGKLIAPPLMENGKEGNIYRQGDCVMSALAPLISAVHCAAAVRISILMQYAQPLGDYPTNQRIHATYIADDLALQVQQEAQSLFPKTEIMVENLFQVPGLDYYTVAMHFTTDEPLSNADILEMFRGRPRIAIAPQKIISTYEIDHLLREESRAFGEEVAPIAVYRNGHNRDEKKTRDIRVRAAIYSRLAAVLPNIDAIRILANGEEPLAAMRKTDHYAGIRQS